MNPECHAVEVVRKFWQLMATNDFAAVGAVLADDYVLDWPQSRERIRGRERFAAVNAEYPANGPWVFAVHRIFGSESEVVSEVGVTDGIQTATAISFFTVVNGKISRQREYRPETYTAPENRRHLVETMGVSPPDFIPPRLCPIEARRGYQAGSPRELLPSHIGEPPGNRGSGKDLHSRRGPAIRGASPWTIKASG